MQTGTIKFFNQAKGFGFIVDTNTHQEYFVHITECGSYQPKEADQVSFEIGNGQKGPMATGVKKVGGSASAEHHHDDEEEQD